MFKLKLKKTADATHLSDYQVAQTTYWSAEIRKIDGRILEVNDQSTPSTGQELKTEGTVYFLIKRLMSNWPVKKLSLGKMKS